MSLSIDHVVISVRDVDTAIETYQKQGFTAFYGGKHASGLTHNGLVVFDDGSYLELIGPVHPQPEGEGGFYDLLRADGSEGYTGFALFSDDFDADIARIRAEKTPTSDVQPGSRTRTDGIVLRWKMVGIEDGRNPFIITDDTPRIHRVPAEGEYIQHKNGALGIAEITILVNDLDAAQQRYAGITGSPSTMQGASALFPLASGMISLRQPDTAAEKDYLEKYGSVPYQLSLIGSGDRISPQQAHGGDFVFAG